MAKHNRIPRRVLIERSRVLARLIQDAAFASYRDNIVAAQTRDYPAALVPTSA